jgi:hypothetical protein
MKFFIVVFMAVVLVYLIRRNLLQVDLSFPLFVAIVLLGLAGLNPGFIAWVANQLGIIYAPLAIILIAIAIILALVTTLAIAISHFRSRQLMIIRHIAASDLDRQEQRIMDRRDHRSI